FSSLDDEIQTMILVTAGLGIFAKKMEDVTESGKEFEETMSNVDKLLVRLDKSLANISKKTMTELISIQDRLGERMEKAQRKGNQKLYEGYKKHYDLVVNLIKNKNKIIAKPRKYDPIAPDPDSIDRLKTSFEESKDLHEDYYLSLNEIETEFEGLHFQQMENEYFYRSESLNNQLELTRQYAGLESQEYQSLLVKKWALDLNYSKSKDKLEAEGMKATMALGSQLMSAFQGESEIMFNVGKAASVANAIINTYEGASKAIATYPPPISNVMAAIQIALGFAQIAKIQSTTFKPKGKQLGGVLTLADMIPAGEDGLFPGQIGEFVMNRGATQQFSTVLNKMNAVGRGQTVPGYQEGGVINEVISGTSPDMALYAAMEDAITKAFSKSRLRLTGNFIAKGKDLRSAIDKDIELEVEL
ncbi:MAG: hypothetical protein V3W20_03790, partial [Candidatus Neomarinimicrobiota bacterium]